jgi:hypothetical protein
MPSHHVDFDPGLVGGQFGDLDFADAMLGRKTAAHAVHDVMDDVADLVPAGEEFGPVCTIGLGQIVVHIAVAHMAERDRADARTGLGDGGIGLPDEFGHGRDRHRDIVLDARTFGLLGQHHGFAKEPHLLSLSFRLSNDRVDDQAVLECRAQKRFHDITKIGIGIAAFKLDQRAPVMGFVEEIDGAVDMAHGNLDRDPRDQLKTRHRVGAGGAGATQNLKHAVEVLQRHERRCGASAAWGTS